jgi:hypothetical protein
MLVDWNAGIGAELGRLFGSSMSERLLARYHVIEPRIQSEHPTWSYRDVMAPGTVTLIGHVRTKAERKAVAGAAWMGHGVEVVVDELEITG